MSSVKPHLHAQKPSIPIARHRSNTAGSSSSSTASTTSVDLDPGVSNEYSSTSFKEEKSSHDVPPVDTGTIRCICRISDDDGFTIQCDKCLVWQHAFCVNIDKHNIPDQYLCDMCDPIPRYYNVKRAIEHQTKRSQAERKAELEERRGGKRNLSPSSSGSSHRKKPSSDDNSLKRRKRSDGGDKTHPKRPASFGLKRKASDDTTEMWESALKQALSSAFNKADGDSGPDKKQKTGHVTITKYENSRESSPLTPRTVEHTSRFDYEETGSEKQSPVYKTEIKLEEEKANVQDRPSNIAIPTRKLSADSTESINVTSPSPTRTSPPPSIAFSTAGQDASANESGDENVDIDGEDTTTSIQSRSPHTRKKARQNVDSTEASLSPRSPADSDNEYTSDDSNKRRKRASSGNKPSKATLDKYRIVADATTDSTPNSPGLRKLKTLPLNLPCKKLWMRNYLRESSKKISEEQEQPSPKTLEEPISSPLPQNTAENLTEAKQENEAETVVDILGDDKDTIESTMFQDVKESGPPALQENDIFSDNESNASTVPAEDLAERSALLPYAPTASDGPTVPDKDVSLSKISIEDATNDVPHTIDTQMSEVVADDTKSSQSQDQSKTYAELTPDNQQAPNVEQTAPNEPAPAEDAVPVTEQVSLLETANASEEVKQQDATQAENFSEASPSESELEVQPQPKVVRLSVKEYLSQRAAAAQRDEAEKPCSAEQQPSAASPPLTSEPTATADST
ncbi:hypothetical protein INT43_002486 [Umbelopsis isabellina]|uniref:Zinc finger PHD-type domain-containing protein n=1 Tax=Mortierella isabellina TaxID=91625 RepID=A0A8H7Q539_MORIS|nr:hypothetical protein INT43_002486 [Umbelopsis isabellina]